MKVLSLLEVIESSGIKSEYQLTRKFELVQAQSSLRKHEPVPAEFLEPTDCGMKILSLIPWMQIFLCSGFLRNVVQ